MLHRFLLLLRDNNQAEFSCQYNLLPELKQWLITPQPSQPLYQNMEDVSLCKQLSSLINGAYIFRRVVMKRLLNLMVGRKLNQEERDNELYRPKIFYFIIVNNNELIYPLVSLIAARLLQILLPSFLEFWTVHLTI